MRECAFAGSWYPSRRDEIERYLPRVPRRQKVLAVIAPHAGWQYSGMITGELFGRIEPAATYILIGPNHHGTGVRTGIYSGDSWDTPLGPLKVDRPLADAIAVASRSARPDVASHSGEHSLEVIVPFIALTSPAAMIVPIAMADYAPAVCRDLGIAIADCLQARPGAGTTVLVASTDMSHFVSAEEARLKDGLALDRIKALDPDGLLSTVGSHDISMCGAGPVAAVLWAANALGARTAEVIRYTNSGEVTGDATQVVAYAGILIR